MAMDDSGTTGILWVQCGRLGGAESSGAESKLCSSMHQDAQEWSEALLRCMDQRTDGQASSDLAPE